MTARCCLQAAYEAALRQQAATAQALLMQQGAPPYGGLPPPHHHGGYPGGDALAVQVAAQLSMAPGYFNNSNINAAAAAAAAAAVQGLMGMPDPAHVVTSWPSADKGPMECLRSAGLGRRQT